MKLFMNKNEKYEEPEVHMFFHKQTKEVEQVEKFVRSLSITIPAKYEDEIYKLYPTDIYIILRQLTGVHICIQPVGFIKVVRSCSR